MERRQQRAWLAWAFVGLLALLCGVLAILQNHWIGELSRAHRDRLQQELQAELNHFSSEFNREIGDACAGLLPRSSEIEELGREKAYSARYLQWRESHDRFFSAIALAVPEGDSLSLSKLDLDSGEFARIEWPAAWLGEREALLAHLGGERTGPVRGPEQSTLIDLPRFGRPEHRGEPGPPHDGERVPPRGGEPGSPRDNEPGPRRHAEQEWLLLDLNLDYVRSSVLPELLQRHLGGRGKLDYVAEVVSRANPTEVIYQTAPGNLRITAPDASVNLFDVDRMSFRGGDRGFRRFPGPPPSDPGGRGQWRLLVRHQAGSLEAVVDRARWQNLATSVGILLLILTTVAALVRFSRRSQQLAELQMNFVAGVSHELRTPVTVIRTAAFNLRGKLASKPEQVERYGRLIQEESEKLTALIEQVLRFASLRAGHVIREREPVAIENVIEEGLRSSSAALAGSGLRIEKHVDSNLPLILADEMALKHALQNLIDNALKYGTEGNGWIGVSVSSVTGEHGPEIELRVADHGPGIPPDEQQHIFDPFFRGRRAVQDQIHGTGLGLNLVKKIVEAHGGTIHVESEPMKKTEFVVRIPAAPPEMQDEFAHTAR